MSILNRIANLTKAAIHEALDKLEDPALMTGQYLRNMDQDIQSAERMLKEKQFNVSCLQRKHEQLTSDAKQQEQRAISALEDGDEANARQAAAAKVHCEEQAAQISAQLQQTKEQMVELELQIKTGKEEYEWMKEKRKELVERANKVTEQAAKESCNISYGIHRGDAAKGFERMEEKIQQWESVESLRSDHNQADANSVTVNEELQRLKEQLDSNKH